MAGYPGGYMHVYARSPRKTAITGCLVISAALHSRSSTMGFAGNIVSPIPLT